MVRERETDVIATTEPSTRPSRRRPRPGWGGWIAPALLSALPWTWFLIRDAGPSLDPIAFALPITAAAIAVIVFGVSILTRMRYALVSLSLVALLVVAVVEPRTPQASPPPRDPFRLVAANTYDHNLDPRAAARTLVRTHADVLVAVETTYLIETQLREAMPGRSWVESRALNVASRWPLERLPPIPGVPENVAIRVEIERPASPFVLYAVHLANPLHEVSFSQHAGTVDRLLHAAQSERLPVVLAGDFNMADRYTSYRAVDGALRDAMRAAYAGSTYERGLWALFQLRIDHVFTTRDWCSADPFTFTVPGSDHEGLSVELGPCSTPS
jgi:endonuclease/exonuclease/phosphatase (EEP) superfamily protein YafD